MRTVHVPTIGDVIELGDGSHWKVRGLSFLDGAEEAFPNSRTLYIDVEPVEARAEIPEGIRRSLES